MGRDSLTKVGASISLAPPIHLTSDSPAAPLLFLLAPQPSDTNASFLLLASQVDPQVWDTQNPSVAKHHSPIVIQLQNPTKIRTLSLSPEP